MLPEMGSQQPAGSVFGCMYKIQHALKNHDLYHLNYLHMMNSPMVLKLKQQILKLKTQNSEYKTIIDELTSKLDDTKKKKMQSQMSPGIKIKKEPGVPPETIVIDLVEDDDDEEEEEVSDKKESATVIETPNIVYKLIEEAEVVEEEEEEEEEEVETEPVPVVEVPPAQAESTVDPVTQPSPEVNVAKEEEEEAVEEEEEEEVEEEEEEEEEVEEEVYEITIAGKKYYTTNEVDGVIYSMTADEEIGDEVGVFKNKTPIFKSPQ